ncbi:MAG: HlyD family efflux transporter periplasmic adaptor subunit [Longimicrobiaceae bacterium]
MSIEHAPGSAPATGAEGSPAGAATAADRRRQVVHAARPFFYTPDGERVELSPDSLGAPAEVDPDTVAALGSEGSAPPPAPAAAPADGPPPLAPGARPIYSGGGRQIFLNPDAAVQVAGRPGSGSGTATPAPDAPPRTSPPARGAAPPRPALQPLSAEAAALTDEAPPLPGPAANGAHGASAHAAAPAGPASSPSSSPASPAPAPSASASPAAGVEPARREAPAPAVEAWANGPAEGGEADGELGRADAAGVEIRTEELDEILSAMPGGLLRWGTSAVFLTVAVLLGVSWFIHYPDVVKGKIALTTPTPPVRLVARTGGAVARVFAADGARVQAGDPLVLMRNPAELADVRAVSALLDRMEPALRGAGAPPPLPAGAPALGTLQPSYASLQQAYADYRLARDEVFYAQKLAAAREQVTQQAAMRDRATMQQRLLEAQLALSERNRARTRELVQRGLAAPADVDQAEADYLQKQVAVENGREALSGSQAQLASQRAALLDLEQHRSDDAARALVALRNAHHSLRAAITGWEQDNLLLAPVSGTVSYFRELRDNLFVGAAEPMVAVVPQASGLVGRVTLNGAGAGKVKPGQRVIIRFESFPYREFGTVDGRVSRVSQLGFQPDSRTPDLTTYQVEVSLPRGLVTSYGRRLEFRQEMRGDVDVVTQDMRLFQRIFDKMRSSAGN